MTRTLGTWIVSCLVVGLGFACASDGEDAAPGAATADEPGAAPGELDHTKDIRGHCDISTSFADDHACIPAPRAGEGLQLHVGPADYEDPAEFTKFIMKPGDESSECYTMRTPNPELVTYQTAVLSGRAGTHHIINTMYEGDLPTGSFGRCDGRSSATAIGSLPGASKAYMPRGVVAPEFAHVGRTIPANAIMQADMHYFNFTDRDILREFWVNVYYAPPDSVTVHADLIRGFGGLGWNREPIQPGTNQVYGYQCPIKGNGHILNLIGHYHAHGKRFTASVQRAGGGMEKVFEMYDYLDPATFDYNSLTKNPDFSANQPGAVSGVLPVSDGDVLHWECHIINDGDVALRYINEVENGEMCNIWGFSVDTSPIVCDLL